ncbi:MAG: hypothetical protein RLZZ244_2872 [Verrucomicrobiota bacterium]|jgi:putative methyltransferase (TIGR04325 family)
MPAQGWKARLKDWVPPVLWRWLGSWIWVRWDGDYATWSEAAARCSGYAAPLILERVRAAMLEVRDGRASGERDSLVLHTPEYSLPLLAALSDAARRQGNRLRVLDVGGSLGTSYYQNRAWLEGVHPLHWGVVEQPHFVEEGRRNFADGTLSFYGSIAEATAAFQPDFVLFSSVLQYVEHPWRVLEEALAARPRFVMIDRAPMMESGPERITVQTVPRSLYEATYPCRLLHRQELFDRLRTEYHVRAEGPLSERINVPGAAFCYGFFERKSPAAPSPGENGRA